MAAVSSNAIEFAADLNKLADALDVEISIVVRKVAIDLFGRVVELTPVDTGRARASWTLNEGSPDFTTQPEGEYPEFQSDAIFAALAKASSGSDRAFASVIFIANGLPYIQRLNDGHSEQAPAGFVEMAVAEAEAQVDTELERELLAGV